MSADPQMTDDRHICDYPICSVRGSGHPLACNCRTDKSQTTRRERREPVVDLLASLVGAVSLLKRGSKKAAPSDRMFDQMIADYEAAIERGRAALKELDHAE